MCAARFARRIAAWVSATPRALSDGTPGPVAPTTQKLSAAGCNGAQSMGGPSFQRNTAILATPGWIYSRAPKATDKRCIPAYHAKHEALEAAMIRKGG